MPQGARVSGRPEGGVFRGLRRRRGRRPSFGEWAGVLAGRLAAALALAAVLPVFSVSLSAQAPIGVCMRTNATAFQSGGDLAPDGDVRGVSLIAPDSLVQSAVQCAESFAAGTLVPIGMQLWQGLAIIITIWTGIQMMFGGGFAIGEVVSLILLLGFPYAVLTFYNTDVGTPWGNMTFSGMVTGMGREVSTRLVDGAFETLLDTFTHTWTQIWSMESMRQAVTAGYQTDEDGGGWLSTLGSMLNVVGWIEEFVRNLLATFQLLLVGFLVVLLLIIPAIVAYCSYLWGYLSILVAIVLGPLLIPWFVVPQLQFLAWGWFRSLLGAAVHLMVAGAVFAVVAQILAIPLMRVADMATQERGDSAALAFDVGVFAVTGGWFFSAMEVIVESLPLIVVAYLGAFKIGEIASMIMNGGSMPGSGIGERMSGMRNMGRLGRSAPGAARAAGGMAGRAGTAMAGKAAAVATGVGAVAVAAHAVMSQATKKS